MCPFHLAGRLLLSLIAGSGLVLAAGATAPAAPGCASTTPDALRGFFDRELPSGLRDHDVPGAVVSVVSGGESAFAEGYGKADVEHGVAFDPDSSLVRIASVTKLFTWTAVMQQVEAGRLDLYADVNTYLEDFQIPDTFPEPVTLRHLMNHTAGFEERAIDTAARTADGVPDLGEHLAENMPARIRPPGEISAYSNYGAALAGHIVSRVSGESYADYMRRHLFDPLGMTRSTAAQPVPDDLVHDIARSYDPETNPPEPIPFTFDTMPPDGSIIATPADMARFMIAHLRHGRGILAGTTADRMHERSFAADPRLGDYAHGFQDRTINGHRVLMHDGNWEGFQSALVLVPECDLGLFVSTNGTGGIDAVTDLLPKFYDRFLPQSETAEPVARPTSTPAEPHPGFYIPARHNESTVEKLTSLLGPSRLTVDENGVVHFTGKHWYPAGEGLYRLADDSDHLTFVNGTDGRRYVATDGPAYQLLDSAETLPVNLVVLLISAVPAFTALAMPLAGLIRRLRRRPGRTTSRWRLARGLATGSVLLGLTFLLGLAVVTGSSDEFLFGVPTSFRLLLAIPLLVLTAGAAAIAYTITSWRRAGASILARIHQVTLLAGIVALTWFLWQWNLIGWQA
ncbi:MAG: serine hydrolase [Pseudonocardiaceae bacterium]|nr:serine hydrolase [Pseudonocardiaceae bacterium]